MVSHTCDWCRNEDKAHLYFFKPRGWIKHKTPDGINMLFCSLACFQKFTGADLAPRSVQPEKHPVVEVESLVKVPAKRSS